jgi:hypothetical protein
MKVSDIHEMVYTKSRVYQDIRHRFRTRHQIDISKYIMSMTKLTQRYEDGFDFVPWNADAWERALVRAGFKPDLRETHLGFIPSIGKLAALATHGGGYREDGSPSLHCAVAKDRCNVHLDNIGFRLHGYNPDLGQHTTDELAWQAIIVPLLGKVLPPQAVQLLHRFHPVVPNSRQVKPYSEIGVEFDVKQGRSRDLQRHWRLTIDLTHSCSDATCGVWRKINGQTVEGDNKLLVSFKVMGM